MGDTGDMLGKKTTACVGLPFPTPETGPDQLYGVVPDSSTNEGQMSQHPSYKELMWLQMRQ